MKPRVCGVINFNEVQCALHADTDNSGAPDVSEL